MPAMHDGRNARTVLIVEDDEDLRRVLATGLRERGFHVFTAGTAEEALGWVERQEMKIDVTVLDVILPDSWGSNVALTHTAFHPETRFVYISGYARTDAVLRASTQTDQVPFLEKPFTASDLADLIEQVLGDAGMEPLGA